MSLLKEFREFAMKGNVVDMAVGVIIGASFGKIVTSLVTDILTPPLGLILNGVDFKDLKITLPALLAAPPVTINYGLFIQNIFDFTIVAFAMFSIIKVMNKIKKPPAADGSAPLPPTTDQILLKEIRDLLAQQKR